MGSIGEAECNVKRVLVLGNNRLATSINRALVTASLDVHQVVYRQETVSFTKNVTLHTSDFSAASLSNVLQTVQPELVISTTSGGDHDFQRRIIDCTLEAGIRRFMPAEFGHDSLNERLQQRLPPLAERAKTIAYLRQLSEQGRIEWKALATGALLDHGLQSGNVGFDLKWQSATLHGSGSERFAASSTPWIGRVVLAAIQQWDEVRNQYLYAASLITSANELLHDLEKATGRQWETGRSEVVDCVREAERRIDRGFPDAGMFLMERSVLYDEALDAVRPFVEQNAKAKLGLPGETLDDIIHAAIHQHKHHGNGGCGCD